ncbi:lipoprotein [Williamsoniiplasma lucivorax]|uniref:Lipoprotein n=1 Tax=Williamsoniiplasma lucivorax TaxID=209274 RepID=A0A2S5RF29_9MOLU|nr:lipoprotein [Williamsoniiplasma lucivorax]PPE05936.1 hypothetical protein ELUCI_v1c02270 [Williamsoniiplasma lucivorax]
MKKLLTMLGIFSIIGTTMLTVVACDKPSITTITNRTKIDISQVESVVKVLPKLKSKEATTIIEAFININQHVKQIHELGVDDFELKKQETNNIVIVSIKESNKDYQGSFYIKFGLKKDLSQTIDLHKINDSKNKTIISAFFKTEKQQQQEINQLRVEDLLINIDQENSSAKIAIKESDENYQGIFNIKFGLKKDLSQTVELNEIQKNNPETILLAFYKANKKDQDEVNNLQEKDLYINVTSKKSATILIKASNKDYQGSFNLTFKTKTDANEIIQIITKLPKLNNSKDETIINAFMKVNNDVPQFDGLQIDNFHVIQNDFQNKATIEVLGDNQIYKEKFNVTFKLKKDISQLSVLQVDFDKLIGYERDYLINVFVNHNSDVLSKYDNLSNSDFEIKDYPTNSHAVIKVKDNNEEYMGSFLLSYNLLIYFKEGDLKIVFSNFHHPNPENLLNAFFNHPTIRQRLPKLKRDEIDYISFNIRKSKAWIQISPIHNKYAGIATIQWFDDGKD